MNTLEALRAVLMASPSVTDLIATRLYPNKLPDNATFPAVVFSIVTAVPQLSFTGSTATRLQYNRVEVDVYSETYDSAHDVSDAIDVLLSDLNRLDLACDKEDERDLYEDETELHRVSMDFAVWR